MSFQQNYNPSSNGAANNNNGGSGDKKTNFRLGKFRGADGQLEVVTWVSDSAVFSIITIKQEIGKDPSTGRPTYEQKAPRELPRVFLNPEYLRAFIDGIELGLDTFDVKPKPGVRLSVTGTKTNQIVIKIETPDKGERSVTFNAIPIGEANSNAQWENFATIMTDVALKKALFAKLDPDEFGMVLGGSNGSDDEPF